ncbi:PREDICTED: uncharacterized protein LOC108772409 [Cyphomyrmex costatus]|uniref:uncharacterized protein LOC108772409 n=1 Tax=Cyphomyrmex costatus TaxID=456900 RepID=UPI0008521ECB|nr:PREDICTED: uncharacterized protein LOC108772409 [Cyphomyrmex costatus]
MGRITRRSTDQEKPQRKRRKKDLDKLHSRILQAKRKLDDFGKSDKKEQKKQGRSKICNRLLPELASGIYRNGTKGKDVQKAETMENTYHKARLNADALKLLNGDTPKSKDITGIPVKNETAKQSANKDCIKNTLELELVDLCNQELSPILGKSQSQNQKLYLAKKKGEENIFEDTDFSKTKKQNINNKSRHVQKEDICKRRLFQNDRELLETITTTSTEIFDDTDLTNEKKTNDKDLLCDPLSRYMEFCKISAKNFEADVLPNYPSDPLTSTINKLKHAYADSFRQQLLRRKKKQELENLDSTYSVEHQACVSSDISQLSPVEFEVPKCSENHTIAARLQEGLLHKDNKSHLVQDTKLKKHDGTMGFSFSCLLRKTVTNNTNGPVVENCENNDNQYSKQSENVCQLAKSTNLFVINEKDLAQLDSQKNPNCINGDVEGLSKKYETNLFNRSNGIEKELCKTALPNSFKNLSTPRIVNAMIDQTKILEPQIGSMKIKDSQESQVEQFNINMHPKEYNERNECYRYNDSLYPRSFKVSCNTNACAEKLLQEQISSDIRKHHHSNLKYTKNQINENACHCNEQYIYFDSANCPRKYKEQAHQFHKEIAQPESLYDTRGYNNSVDNCVNLSNSTQNVPLLTLRQKDDLYMYPKAIDDQHRAVLLQNVTQPVKYLAVDNGSNIQKIPVYINDRSVRVAENVPLKVIAVMDPSIQTKAFPQEIATKVVSLQTDNLHFNNFVTRKINDQSYVKHLDSVNAILLNSDL